ncbi:MULTISPECIES: CDP-glucose 4,6-dehydratase [Achromobacter]|uniref:CDP-glucose 4,6-dehydratase n=1 Tax=Achromobacter insolitus TaxID=217204 RepID=A0A6S7F469_9BURK|nr:MULTISPECIES: CDP-glucose 4,6-dehydratase [Achromobacter]MDQ6212318.1 CDP-glucose 4,6-dehydratase [Achromobacter insolitus]MEB3098601.1 CDP-glucose 4,6-dehydratase [Achromobacter sp. D10]CAB3931818.1 CDP-glucose 4,6-dehydratase [Achromobacter insolitus]CAB3939774.1 CDP-glucose 4,6-dehydratase [Achromobacter insolitus]
MGVGSGSVEGLGVKQPDDIVLANPDPAFWQGRRVLLTGHTGFKGSWLTLWLHRLGAQVTGIALAPAGETTLYELAGIDDICDSHYIDIRNANALASQIRQSRPEIVFHLAAQALVRTAYEDPLETYAANVMGTAHVLDAMRGLESVGTAVMVTTDKVYRNLEHAYPYREDDVLGGRDPYSASKAASELVIASYRDTWLSPQGVAMASARAGNVIGGGDWAADRLIPDAIRCWQSGQTLPIRRPQAIRPWQHVLEPVSAYLRLAERLHARSAPATAYNFGPHTHEAATVRQVIALARQAYGRGDIHWGDGTEGPHEAAWLALEIARARETLDVYPRWDLDTSIHRTMTWYRNQHAGENARALCETDIQAFEALGVAP